MAFLTSASTALLAGVLTLASAAPAWAQDTSAAPRLRALAATCAQCHGSAGHAIDGATVPGLAGQAAGVLVEKLNAYKQATPATTVMQQLARGYSDAQIAELAAWFAAQPAGPRP